MLKKDQNNRVLFYYFYLFTTIKIFYKLINLLKFLASIFVGQIIY